MKPRLPGCAADRQRQDRAGAGADPRRPAAAARRRSAASANGHMVLVGRRHLRSNNSWMHNVPRLVSGPPRCTAQVHPADARAARPRRRRAGARQPRTPARSRSRSRSPTRSWRASSASPTAGATTATASSSSVAREHAGANSNVLTRSDLIDPLSGNAVLNGIPVELSRPGLNAEAHDSRAVMSATKRHSQPRQSSHYGGARSGPSRGSVTSTSTSRPSGAASRAVA